MDDKTCTNSKCKHENPQPLTSFPKDLNTKSLLSSWCRDCHSESTRQWKSKNKDYSQNYDKEWKQDNPKNVSDAQKRHVATRDPEIYKKRTAVRKLKYNYDLTEEQYLQLLNEQNFCCAICGIHQDQLKKKLGVDHCHVTGKVRGLLCNPCNRALGLLKDKLDNLLAAANYLEKQGTKSL
jgi:hypothetical protein